MVQTSKYNILFLHLKHSLFSFAGNVCSLAKEAFDGVNDGNVVMCFAQLLLISSKISTTAVLLQIQYSWLLTHWLSIILVSAILAQNKLKCGQTETYQKKSLHLLFNQPKKLVNNKTENSISFSLFLFLDASFVTPPKKDCR